MARLVIDAIARHNESVLSPKLYFVNFTQADYDPTLADPAPGRPGGNEGVMRKVAGATFARVRQWRRDDLDGLHFLYSGFYANHEPVLWSDDGFPALPAIDTGQSMVGELVSRAPVISSAPWTSLQGLCGVDDHQRVVRYLLDGSGAVVSNVAEVDPSGLGTTWGTPSMTLGTDGSEVTEFVTWTAGEITTNTQVSVRWALRDVNGGGWSRRAR